MKPTVLVLAGALVLTACAGNSADDGGSVVAEEILTTADGEAAYMEFCAGCHETGMMGAPVAGDAVDWQTRSQLWDAVLLDHAITGYLEMPAKGGRMDLPEHIVKAAAEYMLRITYPDMPHDCNPPACVDEQLNQ